MNQTEVCIVTNAMGLFILEKANSVGLAWSGSRWVPIDELGFPSGTAQVSNFKTREEAVRYASLFDFKIL